jgi:hypothetical protein
VNASIDLRSAHAVAFEFRIALPRYLRFDNGAEFVAHAV